MNSSPDQTNHATALAAHRAGDLTTAKQLYENILIEEPERLDILYNLGMVLISQQDFAAAIECLAQVIAKHPQHVSAHYYVANCYFSLEQFALAQQYYEKVLDLHPGHIDALNNLGALLLHENQTEQALQCFSTAISIDPKHVEARNNLAATLLQLQRYYHASEHFRLLLAQQPDDIGVRFSYAMALLDSDNFAEAIAQFQKVLQQKPDHLLAASNLGIAYLKNTEFDQAKKTFAAVLQNQPDNYDIAYLYAALTGKSQPERAPDNYIKDLFNHYAKHYEQHMLDTLHYSVPQQLHTLMAKHIQPLPDRAWHILDLGCGSGLSGLTFHGMAKILDGVDLSAKMLSLAKQKLIYDNLYEDNLLTRLQQFAGYYDLLIAADTFNYFGDFTTLFAACKHALKPSGYLLFSVETNDQLSEKWLLQPYARYTHAEAYLTQIAEQNDYTIIAMEKSTLRQQAGESVSGWLCLWQLM